MKKEAVKFVAAIVLCMVFFSASSQASDYYWMDPGVAGDYSWKTIHNWGNSSYVVLGTVPTSSADAAFIYKSKECIIGTDMVGDAKAVAANVYLGGGIASTNAFLTIKGEAAFTTSLNLGWAAAATNSRGTLNIEPGAVLTVPMFLVGVNGTSPAYSTIGDVNMLGGTVNLTATVAPALSIGASANGNGILTMNGGTITTTHAVRCAWGTAAKAKLVINNGAFLNGTTTGTNTYIGAYGLGELEINSGGKLKTLTGASVQVGVYAAGTGHLTMNGGALEVGSNLYVSNQSPNDNWVQLNNDANVTVGGVLFVAAGTAASKSRLTITGTSQVKVTGAINVGHTTPTTGTALIELQGGTLTGANITVPTGFVINSAGRINITGGKLVLPKIQLSVVNGYIASGRIYTGYGSSRCINVATTATQVIVTADPSMLKLAYSPSPTVGSTVIPCADANIVFTWLSGDGAVSHNVYGGTNFNDVNDANTSTAGIFQGNQLLGDETFELNSSVIPVGQTVYWRIDEVGSTTTTKGNVWSFTREALIDSFESYITDANLQAVWGTNAILQIGSAAYPGTSTVGGRGTLNLKSMEIDYNTVNAPYEKKVTQTLACPQDLTAGSAAKSLVLYFHADKGNTPEVVFVELGDGTNTARVYYNSGDPNRITDCRAYWQFFGTALSDFTGIDLANITSISIGVGDGSAAGGGAGKVYIDDVRVYPSACFASKSAPMGDIVFTNSVPYAGGDLETTVTDCLVNFFDFAGLAINWQRTGETVTAVAPSDSNLVLRYEFEAGSGTTAADSSANMNDGDINFEGDWGVPGINGGTALFHNGGVFVTLPATAFNTITNEMTFSTWVRNPLGDAGNTNIAHYFDAGKNINSYVFSTYLSWKSEADNLLHGVLVFTANGWAPPVPPDQIIVEGRSENFADEWNHWAVVADTSKGIQRMYFNGILIGENQNAFQSIAGITKAKIGTAAFHDRFFLGSSDDFRLYNRALSHAEIVSLAGKASVVQPLITAGDINGDNTVDFKDLSVIFDSWASAVLWP
ncbi:MAG: LamG domain-containing protein [Phycisphaerae bacterium]|jgi:hypothetical protein